MAIAVLIASNTVIIVLETGQETPATVLAEAYSDYVDAYNNQRDPIEVLQNQVAALEDVLDAGENQARLQAELIELLQEVKWSYFVGQSEGKAKVDSAGFTARISNGMPGSHELARPGSEGSGPRLPHHRELHHHDLPRLRQAS